MINWTVVSLTKVGNTCDSRRLVDHTDRPRHDAVARVRPRQLTLVIFSKEE